MATASTQKAPSAIRPGLRQTGQPSSPQTPQRTISSTFSSPGSTFRQEEDSIILELGSRHLRIGFEGESTPQCTFSFGPKEARRVGDYRDWQPGYKEKCETPKEVGEWFQPHELWRMHLEDFDIGLFEDKLERAVREAHNKYLLTDAGTAKLNIVLPSTTPHPLISSVLTTIFNRWKYPSITLLSSPTMAVVAAGLRSGLVIDIGWAETVVTGVYEYREVQAWRSTRAMRLLMLEMGKLLTRLRRRGPEGLDIPEADAVEDDHPTKIAVDFDYCEETLKRLAWCPRRRPSASVSQPSQIEQLAVLSVAEDTITTETKPVSDAKISIPWPPETPLRSVEVPFSTFSKPVERALLAVDVTPQDYDDEEMPLPLLIFRCLLSMSSDVRGLCMSRLVFVGGGSGIPGLMERVISEVGGLVDQYGWSPVRGKASNIRREKVEQLKKSRAANAGPVAARDDALSHDLLDEKIQHNQAKSNKPAVQGVLRAVGSLGPWAGASLVTSLKMDPFVKVEREKFLQSGLAGADRGAQPSVILSRMSFGVGVFTPAPDRLAWTLGHWG